MIASLILATLNATFLLAIFAIAKAMLEYILGQQNADLYIIANQEEGNTQH